MSIEEKNKEIARDIFNLRDIQGIKKPNDTIHFSVACPPNTATTVVLNNALKFGAEFVMSQVHIEQGKIISGQPMIFTILIFKSSKEILESVMKKPYDPLQAFTVEDFIQKTGELPKGVH